MLLCKGAGRAGERARADWSNYLIRCEVACLLCPVTATSIPLERLSHAGIKPRASRSSNVRMPNFMNSWNPKLHPSIFGICILNYKMMIRASLISDLLYLYIKTELRSTWLNIQIIISTAPLKDPDQGQALGPG